VLVTSRHVFDLLTESGKDPQGSVRFKYEVDQYEKEPVITIKKTVARSPKFDIAAVMLSKAVKSTPFAVGKKDIHTEMQVAASDRIYMLSARVPAK
jgi:hypothetical protein